MKKIIIIVVALLILGTAALLIFRSRRGANDQAVLKVTSTPVATVFLDNKNLGQTPFEQKVDAGEFTLKLIPETTVDTLVSWEGKIKLSPNLLTFVNRDLGDSDLTTSGETLTLQKSSGSKAELAVLSTPDGANVTLNGEDKGTTPVVLQDLEAASFELSVSKPGYKNRDIKIKTTNGYKLEANFQLNLSGKPLPEASPEGSPEPSSKTSAKTSPSPTPKTSPSSKSSPSPTPKGSPSGSPTSKASPPAKPYVQVLDTPTGFLNVRAEPSTNSEVLAKVNPGEHYKLLDEQSGGGRVWYKIEYSVGDEGWVSSQYAEKFE